MNHFELERFIMQYGKDIYSFCLYLTKNRQQADDLYQDTFVNALELRECPPDDESAKNFFLSSAVRLWKDKKRKFAWRKRITEEKYLPQIALNAKSQSNTGLPEESILREEKLAFVRACVDKLPEKMRLVVLLHYMENRKMEDIAKMLHIPQGTVKSRLHMAKKRLKEELSNLEW